MPRGAAASLALATCLAAGVALADPAPALATTSTTTTTTTQPPTVPPLPAGVPEPPTPANLPSAIEPLQPYVAQDSCDPVPQPGVTAFADLLTTTYPDTSVIGTAYQCGEDGPVSEHYEGRALDWAASVDNPQQVNEVDAVFHWLFAPDAAGNPAAMARRLGIMYVIWNAHILGTYELSAGWRPYACSGVTGCHENHVHFSFGWAGARKATSFWTRDVAPIDYGPCPVSGLTMAPPTSTPNPTPCPATPAPTWPAATSTSPSWLGALEQWSGALLTEGDSGPAVVPVQEVIGTTADGAFGPLTLAALKSFQTAHGLSPTGVTDVATWQALLAAALGTNAGAAPTPTPTSYPGVCPNPVSDPFTDITHDVHTAAIACLASLHILPGTSATTFTPAAVVDREQAATYLANLLTAVGAPLNANAPQPFTDLPAGDPNATAVAELAAVGVVRGEDATHFDPTVPVTRGQMASLIVRAWRVAAGAPLPVPATNPFTDVAATDVHLADILAISEAKITLGTTATTFTPAASIPRDQTADMLARMAADLGAAGHPVSGA